MSIHNTKVAVVTDSAAALSQDQITVHRLFVPRMEITIDGETYLDGTDRELEDFYTLLEASTVIPTTSAAKPA